MGGRDKAMVALGGRPLLAHVRARLEGQVVAMAISARGDPARFASFALPVLVDDAAGPRGPLAGLLAGAHWAVAAHPGALLLSVPCDVPFMPRDLVARLSGAAPPACASSAGRRHPLVALWRPEALLAHAPAGGSVHALLARLGGTSVAWDEPVDPFLNVNDQATLVAAEERLAASSA